MSLFDSESGDVSNVGYSADISSALANEPSVFSSVGNFVTKGIPLTGLSVINSFLNTGIAFANVFGADIEPVKVQDEMDAIGATGYSEYYNAHQQGIEAAGLALGSFIPGMAGVKAVRLMQAGRFGETAARATNMLLPATDAVVAKSLQEVTTKGSLYNAMNADKWKAIGLGFRDQAVQTLGFEMATLATMNQSPLIDGTSWNNILWDTTVGVAAGGALGGVLEGWSTWGKFKRALQTADDLTKAQEVVRNTGALSKSWMDGNSLGADNSFLILDHLYDIPQPTGLFGQYRLNETIKQSEQKFRNVLMETFATNDEQAPAVRAFGDMLIDARRRGVDRTFLEDALSRLTSVGPANVSDTVVGTTDFFHINDYTSKTALASLGERKPTVDDMFATALPDGATPDQRRRFQMRPFAVGGPEVATFADTYAHPTTGEALPLFAGSKDAFKAGIDLFINERGRIIVNPSAPNIMEVPLAEFNRTLNRKEYQSYIKTGQLPEGAAPLRSSPVYIDLASGDMMANPPPMFPGDLGGLNIGSGAVKYGIGKGAVTNAEAASTPLTVDTDNLTAASRYLWATKFGLRGATEIADNDLPLLDAVYSEGVKYQKGWGAWINLLEKRGITLSEGEAIPSSPQAMLAHIMDAKTNFIAEAINKDPTLSAADLAVKANVDKKYISNLFSAMTPTDVVQDVERFAKISTVKAQYNVGNALYQDGNIIRGVVDTQRRMQMVQDVKNSAMAKLVGPSWENFSAAEFTSADARITNDLPGLISFANADYGTLQERLQGIGRMVTNWIRDRNGQDASILAPLSGAIRNNPTAAAEAGMITRLRRSTPYNYTLLPSDVAAFHFPNVTNPDGLMVLDRAVVRNKTGDIVGIDRSFVPDGFLPGLVKKDITDDLTVSQRGMRTFYELSPEVSAMERAHMELNNKRNMARNDWYSAEGLNTRLPMDIMYAPPIDVGKYPFVALVRPKAGMAFSDDSVAVIAAENAASLQQKILSIDPTHFDVYTKNQIKEFRKAQGDYEMQRNFNTGLANEEMKRKGVFNNFVPNVDAENYLADIRDWHSRQNTRLIRDYTESLNAQLFAEMTDMGEKFTSVATSQVNWWSALGAKTADNPYDKLIKMALNVRDEPYTFWRDANEKLEAFADSAFRTVRNNFMAADRGIISHEEVSRTAENMGLGNPYAGAVDALRMHTEIANQLPPGRFLSQFVSRVNAIQAATAIRLDTMQTLINIVSNPIMTLTELQSVKRAAASVQLPGTQIIMPSNFKLISAAVTDWFNPTIRNEWMDRLISTGIIQPDTKRYFEMQDNLSLPFGRAFNESAALKKLTDATDMAAIFTGSRWSENFVRFTTAMIGRRAFEAQGINGLELMDRISTFTSRVHGNYVAAQRPIAFQGPIGQAASLFQTYQLGLLQNLLRYVQNGEGKTIATFAGLQGSMFGVQGLPGVQMLNQYLIGDAASNPAHKDLYSQMTNYMDKGLADWFLYGGVSNVLNVGLYSRGDINPRQLSIMPLNPLEFPAINGQIQFWGNMYKTASTLNNGGAVWDTIMNGLEHNSLSRPLGGLAQLMKGYSTTGGGNLVQNIRYPGEDGTLGWADFHSLANFGRILGARPLDEAITMDANFRKTAYEANDQTKLKTLGAAAKSQLVGLNGMDEDTINAFSSRYTAAGGSMKNFAREIMDWQKSANVSVANSIFQHLGKPLNQQMMLQMGGMPLPDYTVPNPQRQAVPLTPLGVVP